MRSDGEAPAPAVTGAFPVPATDAGERLDRFLVSRLPGVSRSRIQRGIDDGAVTVNARPCRSSVRLRSGDAVLVDLPAEALAESPTPDTSRTLDLLYVDDDLIVINKPPGLVVHPAAGHAADTLVNALVARFPDLADAFEGSRPGVVHRLDRDTSGVIVVARTPAAAATLKAQFKGRAVEKVYLAVARGQVTPARGVIDAPIGRDPGRRQRMSARVGGRSAQTAYRVLATSGDLALVEARPHTGRTHQIRVHLAAIGHPVVGDPLYGRRDPHIARMALHAWQLSLDHPADGRRLTFVAPVPADLAGALGEWGIRWDAEGAGEG